MRGPHALLSSQQTDPADGCLRAIGARTHLFGRSTVGVLLPCLMELRPARSRRMFYVWFCCLTR